MRKLVRTNPSRVVAFPWEASFASLAAGLVPGEQLQLEPESQLELGLEVPHSSLESVELWATLAELSLHQEAGPLDQFPVTIF